MFAICEYGYYEDYGVYCIEIHPSQKELFEKYCLESQKIGGSYGESIELKGYSNLDYKEFVKDIDRMGLCIDISYLTIDEHQKRYEELLDYIPRHGNHYLQDKIKEIEAMLEYNFN
jgi:hypothetical protein